MVTFLSVLATQEKKSKSYFHIAFEISNLGSINFFGICSVCVSFCSADCSCSSSSTKGCSRNYSNDCSSAIFTSLIGTGGLSFSSIVLSIWSTFFKYSENDWELSPSILSYWFLKLLFEQKNLIDLSTPGLSFTGYEN